MNVLRLFAPGDLRLCKEPSPLPRSGEILLRVTAVGICGSDLHWFNKGGIGDTQLERPLVLGHEFTAITDNGQRVAVDPAIPCGRCEWCTNGNPNLCPDVRFAGLGSQDGALEEFIAWDNNCLFPLPDSFTNADGVMLEPLGVALHAVNLSKLRVGMTVGIYGCGPIGLLIVQLARLSGVTQIIATDILPHRLEMAQKCGATKTVLVKEQRGTDEIISVTGRRGVDVSIEVAGDNDAVETAIETTTPGGRVILVGIPPDERTSFQASVARRKGLTIKMVRRMKHSYLNAIQLVESGQVDVRSLVTHTYPLANASEAFRVAKRREGIKVIIEI